MIESSIIIPAFNEWGFTRKCIRALRAHTPPEKIEVIVVDNSSSDVTPRACPVLGPQLFGDHFHYIRNEIDCHFAGACNQGAEAAQGKYLIFLDHDIEVQPGWYEPLLGDFSSCQDIGAAGPLLLSSDEGYFGHTVQHLGLHIDPDYALGYLYQGIPAVSPLAGKRRFFQAITAKCMIIQKEVFERYGRFDENYGNGLEGADLCLRLHTNGLRMTINPDSMVLSQKNRVPGGHKFEIGHRAALPPKMRASAMPDLDMHYERDGMRLGLSRWRTYQPMPDKERTDQLEKDLLSHGQEYLRNMLLIHPYWEKGWLRLLELVKGTSQEFDVFRVYFSLFSNPDTAYQAYRLGQKARDINLVGQAARILGANARPPQRFLDAAKDSINELRQRGDDKIAAMHMKWASDFEHFRKNDFARFRDNFLIFAKEQEIGFKPVLLDDVPLAEEIADEFSADEYLAMYPDVKNCDPLTHYIRGGKREGRRGRIARIDYSCLPPRGEWRRGPKGDVVVCTSLSGDYERLLPPAFLQEGWRYICYTDQPREDWGIWEMREIPFQSDDPTRKSRWVKMHLPEIFPDARRVIWQDANIVIRDSLVDFTARPEAMAFIKHPHRDCLYLEAAACVQAGKDDPKIIKRQADHYARAGMPKHWGLYETNFYIIDPADPRTIKIFREWWEENQKFSRRDQLGLPFVLYRNNYRPALLLPEGCDARRWPALHFLTHTETRLVKAPSRSMQ